MSNIRIDELAEPQVVDEAAAELHGVFVAQLGKTARRLRDAAQRSDREEVARLCGRLAAGASVYGYKKLAAFLSRAEVYLLCGELSVYDVALGIEEVARKIGGHEVQSSPFVPAPAAETHDKRSGRPPAAQLH